MKKEKYVEIEGVKFEKVRGSVNHNTNLKTLYEAYERPSQAKVSIYNKWVEYAKKVDANNYGIASFNCMMFTFDFMFSFNDVIYYAHITPSNNYLYEVI